MRSQEWNAGRASAVLLLGVTAASAQDLTLRLTHDAIGPVEPLTPVTFTFSIAFPDQYTVAAGIRASLSPEGATLTGNLEPEFRDFNGGSTATPDGRGGFEMLAFTNSLFLEAFSDDIALRDNPLEFMTLRAVPLCAGTVGFRVRPADETGEQNFISLAFNAFSEETMPFADTAIEVQPLDVTGDASFSQVQRLASLGLTNPPSDGVVRVMAETQDGTLIVAGSFRRLGETPANGLARLDADTLVPIPQTSVLSVDFLDVYPNGDLLIGNTFDSAQGQAYSRAIRVDPVSGEELNSVVVLGRASDIALDAQGTAWLVGQDLGPESASVVRWIDSAPPEPVGFPSDHEVNDVLRLPDGGIVVTGEIKIVKQDGRYVALNRSTHVFSGSEWETLGESPYFGGDELFLEADGSILLQAGRTVFRYREGVWSQIPHDLFEAVSIRETLADGSYIALTSGLGFEGPARFLDGEVASVNFGAASEVDGSVSDVLQRANGDIVVAGGFANRVNPEVAAMATLEFTDTPVCCLVVDLNADALITADDITAMVTRFLVGDTAADLNKDGVLDHGDLHTFVSRYLEGCG